MLTSSLRRSQCWPVLPHPHSCVPRPYRYIKLIRHHNTTSTSNPPFNATKPTPTTSSETISSPIPIIPTAGITLQPSSNSATTSSFINPPSTTRPPPLILPTRQPAQSAPSYYFSLGKAYLNFYKTGLKAVYTNHKQSRTILSHLPSHLLSSLPTTLRQNLLTRAEYLLIKRSRSDIARIPLFALVFLICGEFTPLVVVFLTGAVPGTCLIPTQIQKMRERMEQRRKASFRDGTLTKSIEEKDSFPSLEHLEKPQLLHIGRSLGLYSSWWDKLGYVPLSMVLRRAKHRIDEIVVDDDYISQFGAEKGQLKGVTEMEEEEVKNALERRGLDVLGDKNLKGDLQRWIEERPKGPVTRLLLMRPDAWGKGKGRTSKDGGVGRWARRET